MKINVNNLKKLAEEIKKVEGARVTARTIDAESIRDEAIKCEKRLLQVMNKVDLAGAVYDIDLNAQTFPSSYFGIPESTRFKIERFPSGWFVTSIYRAACRRSRNNELTLLESHKNAMFAFVQKEF